MKIWHRVTFNTRDAVDAHLEALRIDYKKTPGLHGNYLLTFEIDESNSRWSQIAKLIEEKNGLNLVNTVFSEDEILNAAWVRLIPIFEHGYPQPKNKWIDNPLNYENYCYECGTYRQKSYFGLKKEPNLGKNDFMTLYWTYAIFCTPQVFRVLEDHQIKGYEVWDAIIHKANVASQTVSQLFVPYVAQPGFVNKDDIEQVTCLECGVTKYHPHMRGKMYLKQDALPSKLDIFQTYEWFGSGHNAFREVIISNRMAKLIIQNGWRGVRLKVVEVI